jgi:hypothetical protein
MRLKRDEQDIMANGRVQIRPQYHSFHEATEHEMLLVNAN